MLENLIHPAQPHNLLAHTVPVTLLVAAALAGREKGTPASVWRMARTATTIGILAAMATALVATLPWLMPQLATSLSSWTGIDLGANGATSAGWLCAQSLVLLLVSFVGWVIARYASTYLQGESDQHRFVHWLLATLAGSTLVVATNHLGVLAAAWLGTSLSLGKLLTFFAERPAAQAAAQKKFLVSRLADLCMLAAILLFATSVGTLQIDALAGYVQQGNELGLGAQIATVLVATAVLLKSAQLPFHGWLMQVMEAPTPVSALLHAGVVNLGGFVLIRLAPLVAEVFAAQALLVVVGGLTAVLAALVMTTRVSIKVALAWSTCAQMGFMLMQCGLGLFEMAWLHLIAHSLYKAHAFLSAGSTVQSALIARMAPAARTAGLLSRATTGILAVCVAGSIGWAIGGDLSQQPAVLAMVVIVGLATTNLWFERPNLGSGQAGHVVRGALTAGFVAALYFGLHHVLHSGLQPSQAAAANAANAMATAAFVAIAFLGLFSLQSAIALYPSHRLVARLRTWFYGGLFLDEWFTRVALRIWPVIAWTGPNSPARRRSREPAQANRQTQEGAAR